MVSHKFVKLLSNKSCTFIQLCGMTVDSVSGKVPMKDFILEINTWQDLVPISIHAVKLSGWIHTCRPIVRQ